MVGLQKRYAFLFFTALSFPLIKVDWLVTDCVREDSPIQLIVYLKLLRPNLDLF
jgi:hypothetical protein